MSDDKFKPTKLYWHELLDRSYLSCDQFISYVAEHPIVEHDIELKKEAESVTAVLHSFYQLVGSKSHNFDTTNKE